VCERKKSEKRVWSGEKNGERDKTNEKKRKWMKGKRRLRYENCCNDLSSFRLVEQFKTLI